MNKKFNNFKTDLIVKVPFGEANKRITTQELIYYSSKFDRTIVVPALFPFDGASVPVLFQRLYPKFGAKYDYASCVHDYLCEEANKFKGEEYKVRRKYADEVFKEISILAGVSPWRVHSMYYAIRGYGNISGILKD